MQRNAYVTGWGVCLPNRPVDNETIENVLGKLESQPESVKRSVLKINGIAKRYYAIDPLTGAMTHTNAALTVEAILDLCRNANFSASDIECLACGTSIADQMVPGHASMVHAELGCPPCEVIGTSGVCCSGVSALKYGFLSVAAGTCDNAVVTGSELASPSLRASHFREQIKPGLSLPDEQPVLPFSNAFLRWMLSDGAGAMLISASRPTAAPALRIDWVDLVSYASESETCMHFGLRKRDDGVFDSYRTVNDSGELLRGGYLSLAQDVRVLNERLPPLAKAAMRRTMKKRSLAAAEVDWFLPHYSSEWFRQKLGSGLVEIGFEVPSDRWFTNLTTKGNTGSASVYIMLQELMSSGRARPGQRILCFVPESSRMVFGFVHFTVV
jgi:3-oxoacyl-[acyl-carrier-protein] synthase III